MELAELLRASNVSAELRGDGTAEIRALAYDSRRVSDGTLFFCFAGEKTDGHDFAPAAVEAGARSNGTPGVRPEYSDTYYAAYVLDPNGNNIEAVFHGDAPTHKGHDRPR